MVDTTHATPLGPPLAYRLEATTVWSFPDRGAWGTHKGDYPGNWSPYIPHNLILEYTRPGDLVLDPMMGSGTTLVEAKLLGRHAIGLDINPKAVAIARDRIGRTSERGPPLEVCVHCGDARDLSRIPDGVVDLVATHPPYANIIQYSNAEIPEDLSSMEIDEFAVDLSRIARECFRVTAPGKHCAVLMGDTRRRCHYVPLTDMALHSFLEAGFLLREEIIKLQWNVSSERHRWSGRKYGFYRIAHERLFVFRKPKDPQDLEAHRWSSHRAPRTGVTFTPAPEKLIR